MREPRPDSVRSLRLALLSVMLVVTAGAIDGRLLLPVGAAVTVTLGVVAVGAILRGRVPAESHGLLTFMGHPIATLGADATIEAARCAARMFPTQPVIPVIDGAGRLCGLVAVDQLGCEAMSARTVGALMREPVAADVGTPPLEALQTLVRENLRGIPVLDRGLVVGLLCRWQAVSTPPSPGRDAPTFLEAPRRTA